MVTEWGSGRRERRVAAPTERAGCGCRHVLTAFDHLVVAVRDLAQASDAYRRLGFDVRPGGRNPGSGTYNAIIRFGIDYIELLSIEDPALAHDRAPSGQALAAYLASRAGGAAAWVARSDDIGGDAARAERAGFRDIGQPIPMRRARPDGHEFHWQLLIPRGLAFRQAWPLLIEWGTDDAERLSVEPAGDHDNGVIGIRDLCVVVPSVEDGISLYATRFGLPLDQPEAVADLGATVIRTRVGDVRLSILSADGEGPIAQESSAHGPGPYAVGLSVRDIDASRRLLVHRGVAFVEDADGGIAIEPSEACGVRLRFRAEQPGVAA